MSYDYLLAKGDVEGGPEAFAESAASEPVGPVESLMAAVSRLFPAVEWRRAATNLNPAFSATSWIGLKGPPEFHLVVDPEDQVTLMTMSRCERQDVERVARELDLVALDEQSMEVFGG